MAEVPEDDKIPPTPTVPESQPVPAVATSGSEQQGTMDPAEAFRIQREAELKAARAQRLARASRRLKPFFNHLIIGVVIMVTVVVGNLIVLPDQPWFIVPLVIWGLAISLHAAYAVGLFGDKE